MEAFGTSRGFVDGRVDIVRSTSTASVTFVKAMLDPKVPVSGMFISTNKKKLFSFHMQNEAKAMALAAAAKSHTQYAINVRMNITYISYDSLC